MKKIITAIILLFVFFSTYGKETPAISPADKARIKEAILINSKFGETLWKGIAEAPFSLVFVTDSIEYLLFHPSPSPDFIFLEEDLSLHTKIYWRKRQFAIGLLATFPAVGGINCIVAGTPVNTGKNTTEWIITLLHEHFHQYVYSQPGYYAAVQQLNLSGGDQTGMWMLNYPFPYTNASVVSQYDKYITALQKAAEGGNVHSYLKERKQLAAMLTRADYRYFSFQLWQEGIARYTEYKFLEAMKDYIPSAEIKSLPDFVPFEIYLEKFYKTEMNNLAGLKLPEEKRVCFYSVGFAEGLVLDRINPQWRDRYLVNRFYLEKYLEGYK